MSRKVRHVMGISGGKDSTALAIYMKINHPEIDMEYYFSDTGKELEEVYTLIEELESFLGKPILKLKANNSHKDPFDHYLDLYNGYLPSSMARWCTSKLKLEPFESWLGEDLAISYVAIRGDEDREGYVSTKSNIQTIFPFRKHMWSMEILHKVLHNSGIDKLEKIYSEIGEHNKQDRYREVITHKQSAKYLFSQKLGDLLNLGIATFNLAVYEFLKGSDYPIAQLEDYGLLKNEDSVDLQGVFDLFNSAGINLPGYYNEVEYEVDGEIGTFHRSRSGCYFCFYQRKIEWIWLYERHPELFKMAQKYEKDGYTWMDNESLNDIVKPNRMNQIKRDHLNKIKNKLSKPKSNRLIDILEDGDDLCANCFI
ncbi:phosphoadenosine phosphosulfate reductase family protein [Labilibacter marinus]|uniref:phosphoadenosine phosphosulfate reductase family protein n=1 Tax=Labilibacter marinus TaxID=1477105 RepID=UPI00094FA770|nr:phosphoadenosine phosphosulfate reductase family protein [Labilibacter marinus]